MSADPLAATPDARLAAGVAALLGSRLAALVADGDAAMLRAWMLGERPLPARARARLTLARRCIHQIAGQGDAQIVQVWLRSVDPELGCAPLRLLQDGDPDGDGPALLASAGRFARR